MTPGARWSGVTVGARLTIAVSVSFQTIDNRSTWLSGERGGGEGRGRGEGERGGGEGRGSGRGVHYRSVETS